MIEKVKILYVEDEESIRKQLAKFLNYFASEVYIAHDGVMGLEYFKKYMPDIVISDIKMPKMNGIDMVKAIKEISPEQHIIFTTAHSESGFFIEAIDLQVDGYILKPVNLKKLEKKISTITKDINNEKELEKQRFLTDEIAKLQDNLLIVLDKSQKLIYANKIFLDFFDVKDTESFCSKYSSINTMFVCEEDFFYSKNHKTWIQELQGLEYNKRIVAFLTQTLEEKAFLVSVKEIENSGHTIVSFTEITDLAQENQEFKTKAYHDELTHIFNRAYFNEEFPKEIARHKRENTPLSYLIFDIDLFKNVNDTYGHEVGDVVLVELAALVQVHTRVTDTFARWGGEEFVEILPNTSLLNAVQVAQTLKEIIENHSFSHNLKVTCSFGVSEFKQNDTVKDLMRRADNALYRAKENGRNRVEY